MYIILTIILIAQLSLYGHTSIKTSKFESGISIYGQIGFVDVVLTRDFDAKTYKMQATATSTGIVRYLTSNKRYLFVSEGKIINGVYQPTTFTKIMTKKDSQKTTIYSFDYINKTIHKTVSRSEYTLKSNFDMDTMTYLDTKELEEKTEVSEVDFYPNDYLSLYLNMKKGKLGLGRVFYVDKKEKDTLLYKSLDLVEVQKNYGDDTYNIVMHHDEKSLFFKEVESIGVAFYGDSYIRKISEETKIID